MLGLAAALFQGCSCVGKAHTFLHYIKPWLRSHRCDSEKQIRTASQKYTVKREDPVWKFVQANAHFIRIIWCSLPFYSVPTHFLALHPQPRVFSNYMCTVLFHAFVRYQQNHR